LEVVTIDEKKRIDWNAIRAEYIGGLSIRKIVDKYGVSFSTVKQRSKREGWEQKRQEAYHRISTEVPQRTADAVIDATVENATRAERCRGILYELIEMKAADMRASGDIRSNEIKHLSGALKDLQTDEPKQVDIEDLSPLVDLLKL
jgi:hypothetical protein